MDDTRFDRLTRHMAQGTSRRTLLRLASGLLGGAAAATALQPTSARPQPKVGICHLDDQGWYRYQEINGNAVAAHAAHGDAIDPDFSSDPDHCGGCGIACGAGFTCDEEACVEICTHGLVSDGAGGCTCAPPCGFIPGPGRCFATLPTTEGCRVCTSTLPDCNGSQPTCATSADCAANEACLAGGGDPGNACGVAGANGVCVPLCGVS